VSTDNTLGIVLSQLSMPNAFNTVMANFNDMLYFALDLQDQLGLVTNLNNRIYVQTRANDAPRVFAGRILTITPGTVRVPDRSTSRRSRAPFERSGRTGPSRRRATTTSSTRRASSCSSPACRTSRIPTGSATTGRAPATTRARPTRPTASFGYQVPLPGSWTGDIGVPLTSIVDNVAVQLPAGQYDGPGFAQIIQSALRVRRVHGDGSDRHRTSPSASRRAPGRSRSRAPRTS
jgi:hypothetical protein